ncbi:MAG: FAD-dependent oxidoreductase, partial [Clostridia bacterium]|nr:FAD-dependent oxidoreductase [Clostridia bacterium]
TYLGRAVIVSTGLKHRRLGVAGEEKYIGRGVSFCAVCDGAFFRRRTVAVVGGGNTALQDALFLSELCEKVYLIHRREGFRAEEALLSKARQVENLEFLTNTTVSEIRGEVAIRGLLLKSTVTGEERELEVSGLFEAVGLEPQNRFLQGFVALDADGYVAAGEDCKTNVEGLFAAGDCRSKQVRQLTTATADGTVAALAALEYLDR